MGNFTPQRGRERVCKCVWKCSEQREDRGRALSKILTKSRETLRSSWLLTSLCATFSPSLKLSSLFPHVTQIRLNLELPMLNLTKMLVFLALSTALAAIDRRLLVMFDYPLVAPQYRFSVLLYLLTLLWVVESLCSLIFNLFPWLLLSLPFPF